MSSKMADLSDSHSLTSVEEEVSPFAQPQNKLQNSSYWASNKSILLYRLKYVCAQPCSVFYKSVLSRIPSGKKVYIILLMLGLEQLAYSASSDYLIEPFLKKMGILVVGDKSLERILVINVIGFLMFPVMGWITDVWVGQNRMIHFSLWLLWFGYAILALLYSISYIDVLPILFAIISVGHSGFQAAAIPFGAEMIKYRTTQELSSYFHCYYWVRNLGFTFYIATSNCENYWNTVIFSMTAVVCVSMALVLNGLFRRWFNAKWESINPYKKVLQVLYLAMVIKRPLHRSAFSFTGAQPPSRLSLTKVVHGGKFKSEEVEDVKTFIRLLVILACIMAAMNIYTGGFEAMPTQLYDLNFTHLNLRSCDFSDRFADAFNISLILLIVPILNFVLYPFLREYMPNMLKRIGTGVFLALLAQVSLLAISGAGAKRGGVQQCMFSTNFSSETVISSYTYNPVPKFYALFSIILLSLAEVHICITSLEFFYAQSPHKMRGMMIGLFFFTWGLSTSMARIVMFAFSFHKNTTHMTCDFWYHLLYTFFALLAFPSYVVLARRYRNRQRGEKDSDVFYRRPTPHYLAQEIM